MPNYKHDRKFFEEALNEVQNKDNALMHLYGNLQEQTNSQNQVLLNEIIGELIAGAAMMAPLAAAAYSRYRRNKEADREHALSVKREEALDRRHQATISSQETQARETRLHATEESKKERKFRKQESKKGRKFRNKQGNKNRAQGTRDVILKSTLDPAMNPQQLQAAIDRARRAGLIS